MERVIGKVTQDRNDIMFRENVVQVKVDPMGKNTDNCSVQDEGSNAKQGLVILLVQTAEFDHQLHKPKYEDTDSKHQPKGMLDSFIHM